MAGFTKRVFVFLIIAVVLIVSLIYFFIPGNLVVSKVIAVSCTYNGARKSIADENNWKKKWVKIDSGINIENAIAQPFNYSINKRLLNGADILIENKKFKLPVNISLIAKGTDSTIIQFVCSIPTSNNPFTKILKYNEAVDVKKCIDTIAGSMRLFLQNPDNVYGMKIYRSYVKDSFLIATKYITNAEPGNAEIYNTIRLLKKYITKKGAVETNSPMYNVTTIINNQFQVMIAIPVNKLLPAKGDFFPRKMLDGKFMTAKIYGGNYTVNKGSEIMKSYLDDYQKTLVAMPFQHLVTDRIAQPDTTKWLTEIYWPVIQ